MVCESQKIPRSPMASLVLTVRIALVKPHTIHLIYTRDVRLRAGSDQKPLLMDACVGTEECSGLAISLSGNHVACKTDRCKKEKKKDIRCPYHKLEHELKQALVSDEHKLKLGQKHPRPAKDSISRYEDQEDPTSANNVLVSGGQDQELALTNLLVLKREGEQANRRVRRFSRHVVPDCLCKADANKSRIVYNSPPAGQSSDKRKKEIFSRMCELDVMLLIENVVTLLKVGFSVFIFTFEIAPSLLLWLYPQDPETEDRVGGIFSVFTSPISVDKWWPDSTIHFLMQRPNKSSAGAFYCRVLNLYDVKVPTQFLTVPTQFLYPPSPEAVAEWSNLTNFHNTIGDREDQGSNYG
uniref:Uncharacterized protein n=1 Tax=Timema bartmani TaxID=61472 RepID=A0A7R9F723_9NEOP|nr:unnamed protein product [Timema bartmani]